MRVHFASLLAAAVLLADSAAAQSFNFSNFASTSGLSINGNAAQNGNKLRLTPALGNQSGSVFSTNSISLGLNASFSTFFSFEILNRGGLGNGADGLTFTVQTNSNSVGGIGGGIGYEGIPNSMAVEFDTFDNSEFGGSNHVGIDLNGSVTSVVTTGLLSPDFDNGQVWFAWVDYNGMTSVLQARWSQSNVRPAAAMLTHTVNLPTVLGGNNAFVGFTSGTGGGFGEHNILSWAFENSFNEGGAQIPTAAVPEPGTYALMVFGLGVIGILSRRRFTT
jgi:hypothetical protein